MDQKRFGPLKNPQNEEFKKRRRDKKRRIRKY
jgi:hypothetical protein